MNLQRFLGKANPFPKILLAMLGVFIGTYIDAMPEGSALVDLLGRFLTLLVLGVIVVTSLGLLILATIDFLRKGPTWAERGRAIAALLMGYFVFDAMHQLASLDRSAYLTTFVAALAAVLLALVIDARAPMKSDGVT